MGWLLLADLLFAVHLAFTVFVIFGGFLAWRFPVAAAAHLPALAWGCWIESSGRICPLTPLENEWRQRAGELGYRGGFIEHYLLPLLYPPGLTRNAQWVLLAALVVINVIAYSGVLLARARRRRRA